MEPLQSVEGVWMNRSSSLEQEEDQQDIPARSFHIYNNSFGS